MTEREPVLDDDIVLARLGEELPHWRLEGGWIKRTYSPNSWNGALMVINAVRHLARPPGTIPTSRPSMPGSTCGSPPIRPTA
jgi:hypothetical protein